MRAIARWLSQGVARSGVVLVLVLLVGVVGAGAAQAATGTQDFSYAGVNQPTAPSGEKPQSKLWFNDGFWWGSIWSLTAKAFDIERFDPEHGWIDTHVIIDSRDKSIADMLWDGTHLYAISAIRQGGASTDLSVRLYRFSYHTNSNSYTPDEGFPIALFMPAHSSDLETTTIDKDSTGELWASFTYANAAGLSTDPAVCATPATCPAGRSVLITHSGISDLDWSTPAVLPVDHASDVSGDDISTVVHFGNNIGVLFSDQNEDANGATADYFAVHTDGAPDGIWSEETPMSGVLMADDHLNMKALPDGRVYVAAKTSRNDAFVPDPSDPMIVLLERTTDGVWHQTTFDTVASADTRSQIVLDPSQGTIYQFATYPPTGLYEAGGWIYCKAASIDAPVFAAGRGTPFIQLGDSDHLNNFSSTKQTVSAATGLLGIATDDSAGRQYYAHDTLDLTNRSSCGGVPAPVVPPTDPPPPVTTPTPTPPTSTTPIVVGPSTPTAASGVSGAPPVTVPVVTPAATPTACVVTSSSVQLRSLTSSLSTFKRAKTVRVRVHATCALQLTVTATLKGVSGVAIAKAAVSLKRGATRIVSVHLTAAGRRLIAARHVARLLLTTRTPAVKGLTPARSWASVITLSA